MLSASQGSVRPEHLQAYLDVFRFRFYRRTSAKRGMLSCRLLEWSLVTPGATEAQLLARSRTQQHQTTPPAINGIQVGSLDIRVRPEPWWRSSTRSRPRPGVSRELAQVCRRRSSEIARSSSL